MTLLAANDNPQALRTTVVRPVRAGRLAGHDRLTINVGLRYELNTAPVDANDRMAIFDLATATLKPVGQNGVPRAGISTDALNFAPRVGASWSLRAMRPLLLRGGYGIFYDSGTLIENSALYFNPPYFGAAALRARTERPDREPIPFPPARGSRRRADVNTLAPDFPHGYAQQGSLGLEGARSAATTLAARWVGAHRRQPGAQAQSQSAAARARSGRRPAADSRLRRHAVDRAGGIVALQRAAKCAVERPHARGLWLRGRAGRGATSIDDQSAFLASDGNDNTPQNSRHPELERGSSDFDVRHRACRRGDLAGAGARDPALGARWQVSALLTAQSGRPFTPRVSTDNSNTGNLGGQFGYDRPNEVPAGTAGAVDYEGRAFVIAPPYTFGDAGRNILTGPGIRQLDTAIVRTLDLGGTRRLELRR